MFVPEWLGHCMLFSFAFIIVIIGLFVVYAFSVAFFDYLIPWLRYGLSIQEEKELKERGSKD